MNENASKMGAALGTLVARNRARHQQERNDLTAVVFCRQNPSGTWTFPGKAPMPCSTLAQNVIAYCTVNSKTPLCKDVAKLGPTPVPVVVAAMPQQKAQPTEQPVHSVVVLQPQTADVAATSTSEVSVAEAARQARIAKAVREAREKAERDNPPSSQQ